MRLNYQKGCAICGATWGDYWDDVEGTKMFFCCQVCSTQFKSLVSKIKETTGWQDIDGIEIKGDFRGRVVTAESRKEARRFFVAFDPKGAVRNFFTLSP
jgi:hypothetical protein